MIRTTQEFILLIIIHNIT